MKKFLALIALVAMVAVSSVAYGVSGTTTLEATVTGTRSITGCAAFLGNGPATITPASGDRQECEVSYSNNNATGYQLQYQAGVDGTSLKKGVTDAIPPLTEGTPATFCGATNGGLILGDEDNKALIERCWSWSLGAKTDLEAAYGINAGQAGGQAYNAGEHALKTPNGVAKILYNTGTDATGTFSVDFLFEAQVDWENEAGEYALDTVLMIGDNV